MSRDLNLKKHPSPTTNNFKLQKIKERFDKSIQNIENKFALYDKLLASGQTDEGKDILRSQIVFLESTIDFLLHEMTKYSYYKMFSNEWNKTSKYKNIQVKMEVVEKGLNSLDSKEWFFEYVNDIISREVYLSSESMKDQLNAIGIPFKDVMHHVFAKENEEASIKAARSFIKDLFSRRNLIVHQNDRNHDSALQNDIDKSYVEENIKIIKNIAHEIFIIANAK